MTMSRNSAAESAAFGNAVPMASSEERLLDPAQLRRLGNLYITARALAEGHFAGRHRSRSRGHAIEFADHRDYCPGDDITDIDWKAYGRSDRLFVRRFEARTNTAVYAFLDCSASMAYAGHGAASTDVNRSTPGWKRLASRIRRRLHGSAQAIQPGTGGKLGTIAARSKFDCACQILAALAFLAIKQGDRISLGLFRDQLDDYLPPGGTFGHLYDLLHRMERALPAGRTDVARALRAAFGAIRRRGVLLVVSDFLDDTAALFDALALFRHRRFDIILLHVLHPDERRLPPQRQVRFRDSETGEAVAVNVADGSERYEAAVDAHIEALRAGCAARRIDYALVRTDAPYGESLGRYLAHRAGRMR